MEDVEVTNNDVIIRFTQSEFKYLTNLVNSSYNQLKKFPKRFRTPKFYILENMVKNYFNE